MINIEAVFYEKIKKIITSWYEDEIYAISFFVNSNEAYSFRGFSNVSNFSVSYNTEEDCDYADDLDEDRWNYACWRQDEIPIVDTYDGNEETELLFDWYKENGIDNLGYEEDDCYNDDGEYTGKGPVGHYELLTIAANVANRLQKEGVISNHFNKQIPIIVHGLEYAWYDIEATKRANPNGEADLFLEAAEEIEFI